MAEPAPTRRSSRPSTAPVPAPSEATGLSRAELRRRAQAAVAAVVAAAPAVAEGSIPGIEMVERAPVAPVPPTTTPVSPLPSSRRARRAASVPVDAVRVPVEPFELVEPTVESTAAAEPIPASEDEAPANVDEPFELVEPALYVEPAADDAEAITDIPTNTPEVDEFEAAARLFSFTGENPVMTDAAPSDADADATPPAEDEPARHVAPRRSRRAVVKRVVGASFSVGVMGVVGLLTVGMTTPAEAVARIDGNDISASLRVASDAGGAQAEEVEIQAYVAPSEVQNADISKLENYSTVTMAEMAAQVGIKNVSNFFVNDPNAEIQWPFAVGVPITYGFGMRSGAMHQGVDFVPGSGAPIQAIADGTVRVASEAGGGYGVHVIIDHVIDGQRVSSHYAHMIYGSIEVTEGQKVTVGTVLGRTGNTGRSFGAHTHFEILMNGTTPIDPIPWLRQHAGG